MSDRSEIVYRVEPLPGGRGRLHRDVVVHGELRAELSGPIGSPAPIDVVRQHERTVTLDTTGALHSTDPIGDLGDRLLLDSLTQDDAP
jgi:hypothetical protein